MKVEIFIDVWPGIKPEMVSVNNKNEICFHKLLSNTKRYKVTVDIPDEAFGLGVDDELMVDSVREVENE